VNQQALLFQPLQDAFGGAGYNVVELRRVQRGGLLRCWQGLRRRRDRIQEYPYHFEVKLCRYPRRVRDDQFAAGVRAAKFAAHGFKGRNFYLLQFDYQVFGLCVGEKVNGFMPFFATAGAMQVIEAVQAIMLMDLDAANRKGR